MEDRPIKYIIARFNEDLRWADRLNKVVIQKGVHLPNVGREASSYLHFIISAYDQLDDQTEYLFCQGDPFDHSFHVGKTGHYWGSEFKCDADGYPEHPGLKLGEFCLLLGIPRRAAYTFRAGAQFKVSGETIKKRPLEFYKNAYELAMTDELAAWKFERLWPEIFNL